MVIKRGTALLRRSVTIMKPPFEVCRPTSPGRRLVHNRLLERCRENLQENLPKIERRHHDD
jgi:hypothetical protein